MPAFQSPPGLPGAPSCPARPYVVRVSTHFSAGEWRPREVRVCPPPAPARCTPPRRPRAVRDLPFSSVLWHMAKTLTRESCCCRLAVIELAFPARRHMTHFAKINIVTLILWEVFSQL